MENKLRHIPAYDGLRVIALFGVVLYHLISSTFKGGYLGVIIFFVLAGFLTARQMMNSGSFNKNKNKRIVRLIINKILKLYPPMLLMMAIVSIFVLLFFKSNFVDIENGLKGSVLSLNNYFQIFSGSSYFENTGSLKPFTHIWALSLEFQFYILAFVFLYGKYKPGKKKKWFFNFLVISVISNIIAMIFLFTGSDFSRIYYSTFARFYSFSIGGMAALFREPGNETPPLLNDKTKDILTYIILAIIVLSFFTLEPKGYLFAIGYFIYSFLVALLLLLLYPSTTVSSKILSAPWLSEISRRSYHIYLWHFPIISLMNKFFANSKVNSIVFYILFILISGIFSEISYRVYRINFRSVKLGIIMVGLISLMFLIVPYSNISNQTEEKQKSDMMKEQILENEKKQKEKLLNNKTGETGTAEKDKKNPENVEISAPKEITLSEAKKEYAEKNNKENQSAETNEKTEEKKETVQEEVEKSPYLLKTLEFIDWVNNYDKSLYLDPQIYEKYRNTPVLVIGDSIASMSYDTLALYMPEAIFDSEHSREMSGALESYKKHENEFKGKYVLLSLGTNGEIKHQDIEKVRSRLNGKILLLHNIVLPYKDEEDNRNKSVKSYAEAHDDVYLIDWYGAAKTKPDLFFDDNIHPGEYGARVLGQIIMKKIIDIEKSSGN